MSRDRLEGEDSPLDKPVAGAGRPVAEGAGFAPGELADVQTFTGGNVVPTYDRR